jgi:hypothetical protein
MQLKEFLTTDGHGYGTETAKMTMDDADGNSWPQKGTKSAQVLTDGHQRRHRERTSTTKFTKYTKRMLQHIKNPKNGVDQIGCPYNQDASETSFNFCPPIPGKTIGLLVAHLLCATITAIEAHGRTVERSFRLDQIACWWSRRRPSMGSGWSSLRSMRG